MADSSQESRELPSGWGEAERAVQTGPADLVHPPVSCHGNQRDGVQVSLCFSHRVPILSITKGCQTLGKETFELLWAEQQVNVVGITGDSSPVNVTEWVPIVGVSSTPTSSGAST